jgi:hypothetical protein
MSPRSFWSIVIKLFSIYLFIQSVTLLPQLLATIPFYISHGFNNNDGSIFNIGVSVIIITIYVLLLWYCIFKTDQVIDMLKLDKGFSDQRFEFNMHRSTVLKIAIMVTGGLILMDSIPLLCRNIFVYFQLDDKFMTFKQNPNSSYVVLFFVKSVIGYFMLTSSRIIVNLIERKRRDSGVVS